MSGSEDEFDQAPLDTPTAQASETPAAREPHVQQPAGFGGYVDSARRGVVSGSSFFAKAFEGGLERIELAGDSLMLEFDEPDAAERNSHAGEQLLGQLAVWQAWFLFTIVIEAIVLGLMMFIIPIIVLANLNSDVTPGSVVARLWTELFVGLFVLIVSSLFVMRPGSTQLRKLWLVTTAVLVCCLVAFQCTEAAALFRTRPATTSNIEAVAIGSSRGSGPSNIKIFVYVAAFSLLRMLSRSRAQQSVSVGARSWWIACVTLALTFVWSFFISVTTFSRASEAKAFISSAFERQFPNGAPIQVQSIFDDAMHEINLIIVNGVFMWLFSIVLVGVFALSRHQSRASSAILKLGMYIAFVAVCFAHGFGVRLSPDFIPMVDAETLLLTFAIVTLFAHHRKGRLV